jgi:hypothetical protein
VHAPFDEHDLAEEKIGLQQAITQLQVVATMDVCIEMITIEACVALRIDNARFTRVHGVMERRIHGNEDGRFRK